MKHRQFSKPAIDRRAIRRGDDKDHDDRVWAAERARLAAEAEAQAQAGAAGQSQASLDEVTRAEGGDHEAPEAA
jgi:hypothetical protein